MGLADITAAICASAATGGKLPATATSAARFLRPIRGMATAVATPLHVERSTVTVQVDITDDGRRAQADQQAGLAGAGSSARNTR